MRWICGKSTARTTDDFIGHSCGGFPANPPHWLALFSLAWLQRNIAFCTFLFSEASENQERGCGGFPANPPHLLLRKSLAWLQSRARVRWISRKSTAPAPSKIACLATCNPHISKAASSLDLPLLHCTGSFYCFFLFSFFI